MKNLSLGLSFGVAFCLVLACGRIDEKGEGGRGSTSSGGTSSSGAQASMGGATAGAPTEAGAAGSGGKGLGGAAGGGAGETSAGGASSAGEGSMSGGRGGEPAITCAPPTPPTDRSGLASWYGTARGGVIRITATTWTETDDSTGGAKYHFAMFGKDGEAHYIIAQNDPGNDEYPCAWTRIDWVGNSSRLFYCVTTNNAATEDGALSTPAADSSDPEVGGCMGGPWGVMTMAV